MTDTIKKPPADDDDEAWLRRCTFSEEHVITHYPKNRGSAFRWFESPNVIDLVRIRRQRAKQIATRRDYSAAREH
jgi:hypothetical protein